MAQAWVLIFAFGLGCFLLFAGGLVLIGAICQESALAFLVAVTFCTGGGMLFLKFAEVLR